VSNLDSLDHLNTLGVHATAEQLVSAESEADLRRVVLEAHAASRPLLVLGGGSNVVLQRHVPGVVCLMRLHGLRVEPLGPQTYAVSAAAGEGWHGLVRYCLGRGLFGLENLALIPGSVGAAPLQNIGAYGVELADRLLSLRAMDTTSGEIREFDRAACEFRYRDSLFKSSKPGRFIIVEVTLQLSTKPQPVLDYPDVHAELGRLGYANPSPAQIAEAVIRVRRRKLPDPRHIGNVGSFFKNPLVPAPLAERLREEIAGLVEHEVPGQRRGGRSRLVKLSAAQLIDLAGWKGARRGNVGVWQRQPLVLVNLGGKPGGQNGERSGADFLSLSQEIRADILTRYGVTLELEPRVVGDA
jgi:UDP-N-acetylmuramate dehydrogenase